MEMVTSMHVTVFIIVTCWILDLFRQWYKQNEDDDPLTSKEDGHNIGNEEQVDIKEENITNPCYSHHHYQHSDHP